MNSITQKAWIRGLVATAGVMAQPKGSLPRLSNHLLTRRGSLRTCDGSQVLFEFAGALQSNRGRAMANFLFNPLGVPSYYLALMKSLDLHLGPPQNLTLATASGGSLAAATYYYVITALDGVGGETTASAEVSIATGASGKNTLTWNTIPNATGYNVYRATTSGAELLLMGSATAPLPVPPPASGSLTQSFIDDGTAAIVGAGYGLKTTPAGSAAVKNNVSGQFYQIVFNLISDPAIPSTQGFGFVIAGCTPSSFNGAYANGSVVNNGTSVFLLLPGQTTTITGTGGTLTIGAVSPPVTDTTQQTALFRMPTLVGVTASVPITYDNTNIVAFFPADNLIFPGGGGGSGGSGGGGGTGGGGTGGSGTPSGGIAGNVTFIPQMVEFTNQVVLALGNGYPPQVYSDPNTPDHPSTVSAITNIAVDAFGVVTVTVTGGHGIPAGLNAGANILISGVAIAQYNGAFPVVNRVSATVLKVQNLAAIGQAASATGKVTTTTIPIYSTFTAAIPTWSATTAYAQNSVVQPTGGNLHIYKAVQGGTSGGSQPSFPTGSGLSVSDGSIIWQEAGLLNSAAPPPPGAAHVQVYSGALWVWNTSATNTANGLDGPCSLRMSNINNLNSWNPINQAFLDKDDGTEGAGLSAFTITAQGIAPQGSLVAFKNYSTYQILGIFGASNFAIQRVKTDMGATAPRTIGYVPGFGIERMSHLGIAVFDGVDDRVVSEEIRPYLFPSNDSDVSDITVMDSNWSSLSWAAQTASPPMYVVAIPIGNSGGNLTRLLCYDMVLKAWAIVDLPFAISTMSQFRTVSANPVTVMGGASDGALSRWQAGDVLWDTNATGARTPSKVAWSLESPTVASNDVDQAMYVRRLQIRGINTNSAGPLTVAVELDGVPQPAYVSPALPSGDFEIEVAVGQDCLRAEAVISGTGDVELWGWSWGIVPKHAGVPLAIT